MRVLRWGAPGSERLDALLAVCAEEELTYDHVGSTALPAPNRYERSVALGAGPAVFDRAVEGLRTWACHRGIGATIHPPAAPIAVGTDVIVVLPLGPVRMLVPTRIVAVVEETDRFGFAYGTLPGHPEAGEERFVVERDGDGAVRVTIRVESHGAWLLARLGSPVATRLQRAALARYLRGLQLFVDQG